MLTRNTRVLRGSKASITPVHAGQIHPRKTGQIRLSYICVQQQSVLLSQKLSARYRSKYQLTNRFFSEHHDPTLHETCVREVHFKQRVEN